MSQRHGGERRSEHSADAVTAVPVADALGDAVAADAVAAPRLSKRVIDAVFGDVLPDVTHDEMDDREMGDSEPGDESVRTDQDRSPNGTRSVRDADLRREVPPHHG